MLFSAFSRMLQYFQYFDSSFFFINFGAERKHSIFIILLVQIHIKNYCLKFKKLSIFALHDL